MARFVTVRFVCDEYTCTGDGAGSPAPFEQAVEVEVDAKGMLGNDKPNLWQDASHRGYGYDEGPRFTCPHCIRRFGEEARKRNP